MDTVNASRSASAVSDIYNLRILPDGSLEKREGYRLLCSAEKPIRAFWEGMLRGSRRAFLLCGDAVCALDTESGELFRIAEVSEDSGEAEFFFYRGRLYLLGGYQLLEIREDGASYPHGYVPLVGKDWSDGVVGEPYEARNLLTSRARISYLMSELPSSVICTDAPIGSIQAVIRNGEVLPESGYTVGSTRTTVTVKDSSAGDRITLYFTYRDSTDGVSDLMSCTHAEVFGGAFGSRPFLWGGEDGTVMHCAGFVSEGSLSEAQLGFPESDALYFPLGGHFTVGDGQYTVTGVGRHYDRLLIFTEGGAWMADSTEGGTEEFPILRINSTVETRSHGSTARLYNDPVTVGRDAVYRWSADTDELDECNAHSISSAVSPLIKPMLRRGGLFYDRIHNELWLYSPDLPDTVWVYSATAGGWSRFGGFSADGFISFEGGCGFYRGSDIFIFDSALTCDEGGEDIEAFVLLSPTDIDEHSKKRLSALELDFSGGKLSAQILANGESKPICETTLCGSSLPLTYRRRIRAARVHAFSLKLISASEDRQRIYSVGIMIH